MKPGRRYFVYRVYDNRGLLLYVGCTGDLAQREAGHRAARAPWFQYKHSVRLEGPFDRVGGFAREAVIIEAERPFFNALKSHRVNSVQRTALNRRLHKALREQRPDIYGVRDITAEFIAECDRIDAEVDATYPPLNKEWRHANYLAARINRKVAA